MRSERVSGVDDELLADGVGSEGPALGAEAVPGGDAAAATVQWPVMHRRDRCRLLWRAGRIEVVMTRGAARCTNLVSQSLERRANRAVMVEDAQDQLGCGGE